jgi:predicted N-acetyltransferase YhbS
MHYQLSDVTLDDAEALVRSCQFPAMRHDPLRMVMFPEANSEYHKEEDEEEEIKLTIEGLEESLENKSCYLRKVAYDSKYVGYAIWTLQSKGKSTRQKTTFKQHESWNPKALDVNAWHQISDRLREERCRVLQNQTDVLSKSTFFHMILDLNTTQTGLNEISVAPQHQRQGVGSMLLRWGYEMVDKDKLNCFVMASSDGLPFYRKFGFEAMGEVVTEHGTFTSMLREQSS